MSENFAGALLMPGEVVTRLWAERGESDLIEWLNAAATSLRVTAVPRQPRGDPSSYGGAPFTRFALFTERTEISGMVKIDMDSIKQLSVAERVRLVQDIWETLQPTAEELPLTEEQRQLIERRLEEHRSDPDSAIPWEQVKARIESE